MNRSRVVLEGVGYKGLRGLLYGAGLGAAFGTIFAPITGTIYGAFFGGMVGLPVGIVGGIVLDIVSVLFFTPGVNPAHYRRRMAVVGGVVGFLGTFFGFLMLFSLFSVVSNDFIGYVSIMISDGGIIFYAILGLIGAGCAVHVSHSYVTRCLNEKHDEHEAKSLDGISAKS